MKSNHKNYNLKTNAINSARWKLTSTVVVSILALFQLFALTKIVSIEVFGVIAIGRVILGFMSHLSDSGMRNAILVKQHLADEIFSSIYWINLVIILLLGVSMFFFIPWISNFYEMPSLDYVLNIFIAAFIVNGLGTYYKAILQKVLNIKAISLIEIAAMVFSVIIAIVLALNNPAASALAFGIFAQMAISSIGYIIMGYKYHPLKLKIQISGLSYFFNFGAFQIGERLLNYFHNKIDVLIIGKLLGSEVLGVYDVFKQLLNRPESLINPVLDFVALPIMAQKAANVKRIGQIYLKMLSYSATILFPIYALLIIIAPQIVLYFFGEEWTNYTILFQLIAEYFIIHSTLNHIGTLWIAVSRPDIGFYWNIAIWFILPIVVYIAAHYNIQIVAISMIFILLILFYPLYSVVVKRLVPISFTDYIGVFARPMLISIVAFIPFFLLSKMTNQILIIIFGAILYGIVILLINKVYNKSIFEELLNISSISTSNEDEGTD